MTDTAAEAIDPGQLAGPASGSPPEAAEVAELRAQLREAQETIEAIRAGAVDSVVIGPPGHENLCALATADRSYRMIFEAAQEGAATVSARGVILDANPRLGMMTGRPAAELPGTKALDLVPEGHRPALARLLDIGVGESSRGELELTGPGRSAVPVLLSAGGIDLDGKLLRCLVLTDLRAQRAVESEAARAHEALREKDALLEQAQEAVALGWFHSDLSGDTLTASPEAYRIFGLPPAQSATSRQAFWRPVHPDDASLVSDAIAGAQATGNSYRAEVRVRWPDGTLRWVLLAGVVKHDATGRVNELLGICQDVTDRKLAEDEIGAGAAYNRSLFEASLDPLVTIDLDGLITDVNTAAEEATGYRRPELLGTDSGGYFTEPDRARAGYERARRDGTVRDYPLELRHRDGTITPVLYNASVYHDPSGEVRGVFAAARDVTEIKRAQDALAESEGRLRALIDTAPVGIDDLGLDGEIVRANEYFCQLTGYTADELRSLRIQDITHPDDVSADIAGLKRLGSGEVDSFSMRKRYLRKDGGVVWAELSRAVVRGPDGQPRLLVSAVRDLTAQLQAESQVQALNAELEGRVRHRTADLQRANDNLEAFTYSVSHDLRAPLRALSGFSQALLEDYADRLDEAGRGYATRIQAASERMAMLIDDLLQLSRVSRVEMNLEPVNLSAEVAGLAEDLRAREPGRRVRFDIQDDVWVTADIPLVRSVLQNLVENAWKFTARRDDATIEFATTAAEGAGVCCYVRDNGAGFDPAYAGKLFQPFQRLHTDAEFPGTGIGLANVRRIIERHGGRTWAEGAVGEGASFYFTLDATAPAAVP
jgi:PAS domain S-box-containing protein